MFKKLFLLTAAVAAAVFLLIVLTLPPRRLALAPVEDGTVAGMLHVHTSRSDGLSDPDAVAAAAARAGLRFLVFTDHGDATRRPDPPSYRSGVLCLDGVEVSTTGGHYIAIDMPASPYPLGGDPRDVVEDVRRLGGFGIVAHPDSPKAQLRWTDWTAPFDAVELVNPDTSWRVLAALPGVAPKRRLLAALFDYPFRAPEVMASLIHPTGVLEEWASAARTRRVVTLAGADAHSRLAPRGADPDDEGFALPLPGYEPSFRTMSVRVRPDRPLTGDAAADALFVARAIRNGHLYTAIDGLATPPSLDFTAANAVGTARAGDVLGAGGALTLRVRSNAPPEYVTVVHDGVRTLSSVADTQDLSVHASGEPGVYWAEIRSPSIAWVRSNPIYVRGSAVPEPSRPRPVAATDPIFDAADAGAWRVEHDANSAGAVEVVRGAAGPELRYRFALAGGPADGQFTALVRDLQAGTGGYNGVAFTIRAERAMRISLQIRDAAGARWQRSVYLDVSAQERAVRFSELTGVGAADRPAGEAVRSVMFVVDTTNTRPGTSGRIWIRSAGLLRS